MIPEGLEKKGWMTFHNMLTFKEQINPMAKDQNINNRQYSRIDASAAKCRSYANVVSLMKAPQMNRNPQTCHFPPSSSQLAIRRNGHTG